MEKSNNIKVTETHTGKIYVDVDKRLEFLTVGDYGQSNNIKADFLGFTKEIDHVEHEDVDLSYKWVATVSTQHGCPMKCKFCDCPYVGFKGNVSREDLGYQVEYMLQDLNDKCKETQRFNLHYARMGEPSFNKNVLEFSRYDLIPLVSKYIKCDAIHPVVSTMLPRRNKKLKEFIMEWCDIKNNVFKGEAGLQFSINSTDEEQRRWLFNDCSISLAEISEIARELPMPVGRKYTLNFPVTKETILDPKELSRLFDKDKFIVKLTPIHETKEASDNGLETERGYYSYEVYRQFEQPLLDEGWQVIVFIPSVEEDQDRITCGNALLRAEMEKRNAEVH